MKPLVIYHNNCADGFGAAFAAWLKFGDEAEYLPMDYMKTDGKTDNELLVEFTNKITCLGVTVREVFILDFSLPRGVMEFLFRNCPRVVWLDHHKSAFEMWCGKAPDLFFTLHKEQGDRKTIVLDDCKSGAMLAWKYFHPGTRVPLLIRHIDDYDRWQFEIPGTKAIARAIRQHDFTFENFKHFKDSLHHHGNACYLYTEGGAILRAHEQNVQTALKQAQKCEVQWGELFATADNTPAVRKGFEVGGYSKGFAETRTGLAANAPAFIASDLGHELALKSGTFGLVWSVASDLRVHCSLRSNGDYDVSAIAKAFGGGGHRNAAGFSTDIDTLLEWLK